MIEKIELIAVSEPLLDLEIAEYEKLGWERDPDVPRHIFGNALVEGMKRVMKNEQESVVKVTEVATKEVETKPVKVKGKGKS